MYTALYTRVTSSYSQCIFTTYLLHRHLVERNIRWPFGWIKVVLDITFQQLQCPYNCFMLVQTLHAQVNVNVNKGTFNIYIWQWCWWRWVGVGAFMLTRTVSIIKQTSLFFT